MKHPIDLHKIGEKLEFNDARERTDGKQSEGILTLGPGRKGPPPHVHTRQIEGFEIIHGQMVASVNRKATTLEAGEMLIVNAGESHTFRNGHASHPLVARFWYEPALNIEWMLQTMGELAMSNGGAWSRVPVIDMLYICDAMRAEYRMAGLPLWFQDGLLGAGAAIARLTGRAQRIQLPPSLIRSDA